MVDPPLGPLRASQALLHTGLIFRGGIPEPNLETISKGTEICFRSPD